MHSIAAKITILREGNECETFTFSKALAVTIWLAEDWRKGKLFKMWEEWLWIQNQMWNLPAGWKVEFVRWGVWKQLLHKRQAARRWPQAEGRGKSSLETLPSRTWRKNSRVFNETDKCLWKLPCQTGQRGRIEMSTADCVMNSKSEFHQAPLVRVVPVNGLELLVNKIHN